MALWESEIYEKDHDQNTDTGTTSTTFQIDSDADGPVLENNSGNMRLRNAADDDDATLTVKELIETGDPAATKNYWWIYNDVDERYELWTTDGDGAGTDTLVLYINDGETEVNIVSAMKAASYKTGAFTLTVDETKAVSAKANKDTDAVVGNLTQFTTGGDIMDSGIAPADKADTVAVNPKALSQGIHMTAAASGSNGIQVANNDDINFGTGDFTLVWKGSLPDWIGSTWQILFKQYQDANNQWYLSTTLSAMQLHLKLASSSIITSTASISSYLIDGVVHEIVISVDRLGPVNWYIDGKLVFTEDAGDTSATDFNLTQSLYISGSSTTRNASNTQAAILYNRALDADDVAYLYKNGIDPSDMWGSQTELLLNGGFESWASGTDATSWDEIVDGGAYTFAQESTIVNGGSYSGKISCSGNGGTAQGRYNQVVAVSAGNLFRISGYAYMVNASSEGFPKIQIQDYGAGNANLFTPIAITTAGSWQYFSIETDTPNVGNLGVSLILREGTTQDIYFDDVSIVQIGATAAYFPENIQPVPGQWLDAANNHHAKMPAAGATLIRPKNTFEIRWTNTWAGTHEAQYIGGFNQNILPENAYIESIIGTVSGTTIEDIIIGDGSDTDRFVAITSGLATGTTSFTIANPTTDGTNRKMVVDPDANFTGSIVWTITGKILEA